MCKRGYWPTNQKAICCLYLYNTKVMISKSAVHGAENTITLATVQQSSGEAGQDGRKQDLVNHWLIPPQYI